MKNLKKKAIAFVICVTLIVPKPAKADLWGGDLPLLASIVTNTLNSLLVLKQIFKTGSDTLGLMKDINQGIKEGLSVIQIINPKFNPGLYGNLETADRVLQAINDLYGRIPNTGEARLQEAQDRSVAESIAMNGTLFRYADDVDSESRRIIAHAQNVSPQGAGKLTAQSLAVLIGVSTQVLRTNSMMLKMMAENMALQNRKDKIQSSQFKGQYEGLSGAFKGVPKETKLQGIGGN